MKGLLITMAASFAMMAWGLQSHAQTSLKGKKCLVLYYSQTGATKTVAESLVKLTGADECQIEVDKPYTGDFNQTISRCQAEMNNGELPKVNPLKLDPKEYDVIFLGYPIWFGTCARPMLAFLKQFNLDGKTIIPFCTFGSGGLEVSVKEIEAAWPKAKICEGYGARNARVQSAAKELDYFLKSNGYIQGNIKAPAAFSEQKDVTPQDKALFDAACGDYQFPLGTPQTVGSRQTDNGTEYKFTVKSRGMDGKEGTTTIYVIKSDESGAKPEFTKVVR